MELLGDGRRRATGPGEEGDNVPDSADTTSRLQADLRSLWDVTYKVSIKSAEVQLHGLYVNYKACGM